MMKKSSVAGFFALAAVAFAAPATVGTDPRLLSAIRKANSDFEVAVTKADAATIAEPYTTDAVFVGVDGTATNGRARIEQLYRDRFTKSGPAVEARIESQGLTLAGNLAYERGRGRLTRLENGKRVSDWARFLTIWQRQADGDWKIFRNVVLPGE